MCNKEKFWPVLCDAIGRPELGSDPDYASFADRLRNRDQLTEVLYDALSTHTTEEWMEKFASRVLAALVMISPKLSIVRLRAQLVRSSPTRYLMAHLLRRQD